MMRITWVFSRWRYLLVVVAFVVLAAAAGYVWYFDLFGARPASTAAVVQYKTPQENDVYVRFDMEAFDKILDRYWQKATDADLAEFYQLALQKTLSTSTSPVLPTKDRSGTARMLAAAFATLPTDAEKKDLATKMLMVTLYNMAPIGRNNLLSAGQEVQLRQEVSNVNPNKDLYTDLGVATGATTDVVDSAYKEKKAELEKAATPDAQAQLQKVSYAHQVLTDTNQKARYDEAKIEPTVFKHILGKTLYVYIQQISPTTLQEFAQAVDAASTTSNLDSMILDVRGNIGGALDFASYFLGLFVGQNQYAFDFFHQGNYEVQRTPTPKFEELSRFKDIALVTDNMTQSTAEVVTAMFKRFKIGTVVGGTTRGWGSVENTIPLDTVIDPSEKFSLLLVQYLTLRDDNVPIEGKGVDPNINIADKNWKQQVVAAFHSSSIVSALSQYVTVPPLR